MRAVVQRVTEARVLVEAEVVAEIAGGMLVLAGIGREDDEETARRMAARLLALRIFDDGQGRMNESLGRREILCVSQFTLLADTGRGNRPGFAAAAPADRARPLYELLCDELGAARGAFGERMRVELANDGPVTLLLES